MTKPSEIVFQDPTLASLYTVVTAQFGELPVIIPAASDQYFGKLCESIVSQQLSTKVADVIEARVKLAIGGEWHPEKVLVSETEVLRAAGLSNAKASYIKNIAQVWVDGSVVAEHLTTMTDEEIITELVKIKGVGRWTAEMFLIFTLGRSDVFSVGDYALRKATAQLYNLDIKAKPAEFLSISQNWSPNRSLASRILWKSLERK